MNSILDAGPLKQPKYGHLEPVTHQENVARGYLAEANRQRWQ